MNALVALLVLAAPAASPTPAPTPTPVPIAITGALLHVGDGTTLANATVIVSGDRITAAGAGIAAPAGARVIDARNKVVTPGLVDALNHLGTSEIELVEETNEFAQADGTAIRAAFRVADAVDPDSAVIPVTRMEGVTSAVSVPEGGLVRGQSAWLRLTGDAATTVLVAPAAMHASFDASGRGAAGGRAGVVRRLREALDDARLLRARAPQFEENRLRGLSASRLDLLALLPVIDRKLVLSVRANRASDIRSALAFAREENLRLVIEGGAEAWRVAPELAAASVPVVLKPTANLPSSFDTLGARSDAAALLHAAGVKVVIASVDTHNARTVRQEAGTAAAWGLPREQAIAAITGAPADVYGAANRVGRVAPGRLADLVVWSGDPLELSTEPEHVFVGGVEMPRRSRQTELLERYRTLPPKR